MSVTSWVCAPEWSKAERLGSDLDGWQLFKEGRRRGGEAVIEAKTKQPGFLEPFLCLETLRRQSSERWWWGMGHSRSCRGELEAPNEQAALEKL